MDDFQDFLLEKTGQKIELKLISGMSITGKLESCNGGYITILHKTVFSSKEKIEKTIYIPIDKILYVEETKRIKNEE